jgi:glycosyltransferase involved in cell wall biosynthesis
MPTYSICITHFNNGPMIRKALDSIFNQIDERFEVVLVDNLSTDGSRSILYEFQKAGKIQLIERRCSRGKGRQIAFENSSGEYVIANLDMDDVFRHRLIELLERYHFLTEGDMLWAQSTDIGGFWGGQSTTIAPRILLSNLGGWRDLQFCEDWELASRAAKSKRYHWTKFNLLESVNLHLDRQNVPEKLRFRYGRYRDLMSIGRNIFSEGENVNLYQRVIAWAAKLSLPFHTSYFDSFNRTFDPYDKSLFINFEGVELPLR